MVAHGSESVIGKALRRHLEANPEADQHDWRVSDEFRPHAGSDESTELRIVHVNHLTGSYYSAGDAGKPKVAS